ncbi:hypothetical protein JX265_006281 [Neoarthrinium moseri]|uniref:Uncharacterized protein n=1 Tax=Neoarthrinium moseri TaxID=1658444 RepID=A0A9Q0APL3_9PEZI|nr:uncharacterized protein JN550_011959 [Neoarthrinium moseri]KAI1859551.1 hypothetical protein JN550_011959 [Neoarthrinium moseri]KAI1870111.1 hypothetical protein JX265_006281 [Neoarthrinium moseri]
MSEKSTSNDGANNRTLIITLSTVLSVVGVVVISIAVYLCLRNRRRRLKLFNRGITPIDDDEIATWKTNRNVQEKGGDRYTTRRSNSSAYTHRHAPSNSLIQYQSNVRPSLDTSPQSPRSFIHKQSFEAPQSLPGAVLAKAPNARSGLTDEAVPGDEPFVAPIKRQPSKLNKAPPSSSSQGPQRTRGSRSSSMRSFADAWYGENMVIHSPRTSYDTPTRTTSRVYSTSTAPPRLSLSDTNDHFATVLSPPPLHRTEIGRALG